MVVAPREISHCAKCHQSSSIDKLYNILLFEQNTLNQYALHEIDWFSINIHFDQIE